ncbi:hypothetical protein [Halocola ammonii]
MTSTIEETLDRLNLTLSSQQFDAYLFMKLIEKLLTEQATELKIIDLKNNTEAALTETQQQKALLVKSNSYEQAAILRDKERFIKEHIELRKTLEIEFSQFMLKRSTLFYFYLGTEKHDDIAFHLISRKEF